MFQSQKPENEDYAGLNQYTIEAVADDLKHIYNERNFNELVEELRKRNVPCMWSMKLLICAECESYFYFQSNSI